MILSEEIAKLIEQMLSENDGSLELKRNELAYRVGCVPSQINYVITSRFTPARGYQVESRRGGGGYVKITKLSFDKRSLLAHFYDAIGESISASDTHAFLQALRENGAISAAEEALMRVSASERTLQNLDPAERAKLRARILKSQILALASL